MQSMTFRNSKIVYHGPHPCNTCAVLVARMGYEFGGTAFTYPEGPVYPNTEWHPHVCDPHAVHEYKGACAKGYVQHFMPEAAVVKNELGRNLEVMDIATGLRKVLYSVPNSIQAPNGTPYNKYLS